MIKYHRLKEGWSQFDLALKLGLTSSQGRYLIKDYETRGLYPPKELSIKLAMLFKLNTKYFYDEYLEFLDVAPLVLKKLRLDNNYSKSKSASIIGTTRETWTRWEQGYPISRFYYNKLKIIQLSTKKES
ncbi:hypothetical protein CPJCM30710_25180 [Clostridium polyendosporum]|uniref:HTH cro/C1-type domain-containing protein n=1 Tax=Clostridium polyendosporum TaxID=69208 RepID=A0A919VH42_9CLOT|nr:helix-turn-helix transcriptional regulator [Clostridium polyendosporum]GIM29852.1 hypothetical protein CPJCM30710_25180 [Clostridium polyendosporum]